MALLVEKYGGTSLGDPERVRRVASRVAEHRRAGHDLVVVASAMGHTTDELTALAEAVAARPRREHPREMDMLLTAGERIAMALLAMAIRELGIEAISFTGSQAAIITDAAHTGARIEEVRAERVRAELGQGRVVIVAGFQGVSRQREITTLGRGGSDTTAVALAAALEADRCDIYTDVDGVYTADPRHVSGARRVEVLDYDEMLELAQAGAQVMHPRAVEIGARFGVPIRVLSSIKDGEDGGTLITRKDVGMEDLALTGIAAKGGWAQLILRGLPAEMRVMASVLHALTEASVSIDILSQADRPDGRRQIAITVQADDVDEARAICDRQVAELGGERVDVREGLSRVTLVGSGMHDRPGVYATVFRTLMEEEVEVHGVTTSAVSIAVVVKQADEQRAVAALHAAFGLAAGSTP